MAGLKIWVQGVPASQGSKTPVGQAKDGHYIMKESSDKGPYRGIRPWRNDVKDAAEDAMAEAGLRDPIGDPVVMMVTFYFLRPKNHYRTGRFSGELKPTAPMIYDKKPDLDKLIRGVGDSLKSAGVYVDDSQVVRWIAAKEYASPTVESPKPGAVIHVFTIDTDLGPLIPSVL